MTIYALVKPHSKKLFSALVVLLAIIYLFYATQASFQATLNLFENLSVLNIITAICCINMMLLLKSYYHLVLLRQVTNENQRFDIVVPAYLQAQVVRYLPGKIWGLVYQSQQLKGQASTPNVILVNLFQMLNTNFLACGIILSVIAGQFYGNAFMLIALIITFTITELIHIFPKYEMITIKILAKYSKYFHFGLSLHKFDSINFRGTVILSGEWLFYLTAFYILLHESYTTQEVMLVAIWYSAASLIAILAILVPAGLAVREAIFIAGSSMLPVDNSAFLAVAAILRLIFICSEIFVIPIGIWLGKFVNND